MSPIPPPTAPRARRCDHRKVFCTDAGTSGTFPKARIMDWSALEATLIRISDGSIGWQRRFGACDPHHTRAWLIRQGSMEAGHENAPATIPAGQWVIATPGCDGMAFSRNAKTLLLSFDTVWPTGESFFDESMTRSFGGAQYPRMEETALALLSYVNEYIPGTTTSLRHSIADLNVFMGLKRGMDSWLEAFVSAMTAEGAVPTRLGIADQRIQRAVRLLDSWPLEEPLNRERIAREAGITVAHLERLFMAQLHVTPSRYFDRRRIDRACRSLCESEIAIKAIAFGMGFHSEAHFSHWFKQHQQACPRRFRQDHVRADV